MTKPGDVDHYTRVRCYERCCAHYPEQTATLSLLPLAMRMGGPREALWHAIIRKNYGCTHFIVGRDHAGPGNDRTGKPFYGPYDAQELFRQHEEEIGIAMVPFHEMVYVAGPRAVRAGGRGPGRARPSSTSPAPSCAAACARGSSIPEWFTFPEVVEELRRTHPPRHQQGFTVFFTGLSGSGKSTIANALLVKLLELGGRPVTLLDGDVVRKHLSSRARLLAASTATSTSGASATSRARSPRTAASRSARRSPLTTQTRRKVRDMIEPVRRLPRDPRRHAARGLRGARPQGALRQGAGRA